MKTLALILTALAASAAFAQPPPQPADAQRSAPSGGARARYDPNQIICRSEPAVGSRLRGVLRCATRAQWAESIRLERQYVEKAQTSRTFCGGICVRRMGHGF
ncbi:MAG TPA: hypothetical protein VK614_02730 [Allosphingosinicella sp.]|nr:hypothetical protein [Allosphingosinicella sp.]